VTTTSHKTLRGPRAGMVFYKRKYQDQIDKAVFPALQGGPHMHTIAAIAVALRQASAPEFKAYAKQVRANARALADELIKLGYDVVSNGTDNHIVLWNLQKKNLTGSKLEKLFERASISVNKNAIFGDKSALSPGGVRLGSPSLTSRGFTEEEFRRVAHFLDKGVKIALEIQETEGKMLKNFVDALGRNEKVAELKKEVEEWARTFPLPGF